MRRRSVDSLLSVPVCDLFTTPQENIGMVKTGVVRGRAFVKLLLTIFAVVLAVLVAFYLIRLVDQ